jgi:hypothetical protein
MIRKLLLVLLVVIPGAVPAFAQQDDRVLLYYFQNLTGERRYDDLIYAIPMCMFRTLKASGSRIFIADQQEIHDREGNVRDLWAPDFIRSVAAKRGISTVLYGFFYMANDRVIVRAQVFYLESGLLLELSPERGPLYEVVETVQGMSPSDLRRCGRVEVEEKKEKPKVLKVQQSTLTEIKKSSPLHTLTWSAGTALPVGQWAGVYPPGLSLLFAYKVYPKSEVSPLGIGFRTGVYAFFADATASTVASETFIFPFTASLDYILLRSGMHGRLVAHFTLGTALSVITIEAESHESFDLIATGSLGAQFAFSRQANLFARVGMGAISFRGSPLYLLNGELGVRFFQ